MRRLTCAAAFLAAGLTSFGAAQEQEIARLAAGSPMIFLGTVISPPPSTRALTHLATVRVDATYRGAKTVGDFTDQQIVVERPTTNGAKTVIFFVTPAVYGKTLLVKEVGEIVPPDRADFAAVLARVDQAESNRKLLARLASAEAVIIGRVMSVDALEENRSASEHDPQWAIARVAVLRVLKGAPRAQVDVVFANSMDIRWFGSPKLRVADEAIFLLRREAKELLRESEIPRPDAYLLLDREDLRSVKEERRIRSLLSR